MTTTALAGVALAIAGALTMTLSDLRARRRYPGVDLSNYADRLGGIGALMFVAGLIPLTIVWLTR